MVLVSRRVFDFDFFRKSRGESDSKAGLGAICALKACPEGARELSPGFRPWEEPSK